MRGRAIMPRKPVWIGLDVGADETTMCAVGDQGEVILEDCVPTEPTKLHLLIKPLKRRIVKIALESGPYGMHLTRTLRDLGYQVAVLDCRQASKFLSIRQNKTDTNDARGIADIARIGGEA